MNKHYKIHKILLLYYVWLASAMVERSPGIRVDGGVTDQAAKLSEVGTLWKE